MKTLTATTTHLWHERLNEIIRTLDAIAEGRLACSDWTEVVTAKVRAQMIRSDLLALTVVPVAVEALAMDLAAPPDDDAFVTRNPDGSVYSVAGFVIGPAD